MVPGKSNEKTLAEAGRDFLKGLKGTKPEHWALEMNRFIRWYGTEKKTSSLTPLEVSRYAESNAASATDPSARIEPIKEFLNSLYKAGLTENKLSTHLKYRRTGARPSRGSATPKNGNVEVKYLTKEGHGKLKEELQTLVKDRVSVAEELKRAMADKDFRENAPLDAARERQAYLEARIRELQAIFKRSEIMLEESAEVSYGRIKLGSRVSIRDLSTNEILDYTLVSSWETNLRESKISVDSPIGMAIIDRASGEHVEVKAPVGLLRYRIEKVDS